MIAEKTVNPVLTTRYVPATMVLTIRSSAMAKNSSIEGSDGDSLSEKIPEATPAAMSGLQANGKESKLLKPPSPTRWWARRSAAKKTYSMKGVFERRWNKRKTGARWA